MQEENILCPFFFPVQGQARLADRASSPRGLAFTFLGPVPGWPLRPELQTLRQALLAGTKLPWAGVGVLMVKGRARGHSKSFTNISQSFIIFALPTAAHKSTKVHELHPPAPVPQRCLGLTPRFRAPRTQTHSGPGWISGAEGCPGLKSGFWICEHRPEVLEKNFFDCFNFLLVIQKLVSASAFIWWGRAEKRLSASQPGKIGCLLLLCTLHAPHPTPHPLVPVLWLFCRDFLGANSNQSLRLPQAKFPC